MLALMERACFDIYFPHHTYGCKDNVLMHRRTSRFPVSFKENIAIVRFRFYS